VHDNLRNLGVDVLDVVNLCAMGGVHAPSEGSIATQFTARRIAAAGVDPAPRDRMITELNRIGQVASLPA
jgi:hypothetical protein